MLAAVLHLVLNRDHANHSYNSEGCNWEKWLIAVSSQMQMFTKFLTNISLVVLMWVQTGDMISTSNQTTMSESLKSSIWDLHIFVNIAKKNLKYARFVLVISNSTFSPICVQIVISIFKVLFQHNLIINCNTFFFLIFKGTPHNFSGLVFSVYCHKNACNDRLYEKWWIISTKAVMRIHKKIINIVCTLISFYCAQKLPLQWEVSEEDCTHSVEVCLELYIDPKNKTE